MTKGPNKLVFHIFSTSTRFTARLSSSQPFNPFLGIKTYPKPICPNIRQWVQLNRHSYNARQVGPASSTTRPHQAQSNRSPTDFDRRFLTNGEVSGEGSTPWTTIVTRRTRPWVARTKKVGRAVCRSPVCQALQAWRRMQDDESVVPSTIDQPQTIWNFDSSDKHEKRHRFLVIERFH